MRALSTLLGVMVVSFADNASAYCRLRTCDPNKPEQQCVVDEDDCVKSGRGLYWASNCVTFAVQEDGSRTQGIDADTLERITERAFRHWLEVDCGGDPPSIHIGSAGSVACNSAEYNEAGRNANVVLFHDDEWPHPDSADAYGHTRLNFDKNTGALFDADIAINAAEFPIAADPHDGGADLESILTHEIGHFLGLGHAAKDDDESTMRAGWDGTGTALRSLSADDAAGICAIYPPERESSSTSCEPKNGFASECDMAVSPPWSEGCSATRARPRRGAWSLLVVAAGLLGALLRRHKVMNSPFFSPARPSRPR